MLGSSGSRFGIIWQAFWDYLAVILGSSGSHFGIIWQSFCDYLPVFLGSSGSRFGINLGPEPLIIITVPAGSLNDVMKWATSRDESNPTELRNLLHKTDGNPFFRSALSKFHTSLMWWQPNQERVQQVLGSLRSTESEQTEILDAVAVSERLAFVKEFLMIVPDAIKGLQASATREWQATARELYKNLVCRLCSASVQEAGFSDSWEAAITAAAALEGQAIEFLDDDQGSVKDAVAILKQKVQGLSADKNSIRLKKSLCKSYYALESYSKFMPGLFEGCPSWQNFNHEDFKREHGDLEKHEPEALADSNSSMSEPPNLTQMEADADAQQLDGQTQTSQTQMEDLVEGSLRRQGSSDDLASIMASTVPEPPHKKVKLSLPNGGDKAFPYLRIVSKTEDASYAQLFSALAKYAGNLNSLLGQVSGCSAPLGLVMLENIFLSVNNVLFYVYMCPARFVQVTDHADNESKRNIIYVFAICFYESIWGRSGVDLGSI